MCTKTLQCEKCEKLFVTSRKRRFCHDPCGKTPNRIDQHGICRMCKQAYCTVGKGKGGYCYCSDECRNKKALTRRVSDEAKEKARAFRISKRSQLCACCGVKFTRSYSNPKQKYCSTKCATLSNSKARKSVRIPCMCRSCGSIVLRTEYEAHGKECFCDGECYLAYRKTCKSMKRIKCHLVESDRKCQFCDGPIIGWQNERRIYCSKRCVQSAAKQKRKMLKVCNGPVDIIDIDVLAEKANWICNQCGCECRKSTGNNSADDATIDHVIPVAKGGTHTWSNVQLLCRMCNTIKSDNLIEGTQLELALV